VSFSPDGRRVLTGVLDQFRISGGRVWMLPDGRRSRQDLLQLATCLSGHRIDPEAGLVPAESEAISNLPRRLRVSDARNTAASAPQTLSWHLKEADDAAEVGEWSAVIAHLAAAIEVKPSSWPFYARRARAYAELGQWENAAADNARAIALGAEDCRVWYELGLQQLALGDSDGYHRTCVAVLARFGKEDDPFSLNFVAATCQLASAAMADQARALAVAQQVESFPGRMPDLLHSLGAALYRAGRFEAALPHLDKAAVAGPGTGSEEYDFTYNALFLAMCHHRLGHSAMARQWLDQAREGIEPLTGPSPAGGPEAVETDAPVLPWWIRLELQLLLREAEALLSVDR
jgi:tetratricopeptide (TPR) repeat protein